MWDTETLNLKISNEQTDTNNLIQKNYIKKKKKSFATCEILFVFWIFGWCLSN